MELLDNRFQVVGRIGRGGMAEIFLAKTLGAGGFERLVVIKRLHPHLRSEAEFTKMFLDEARTVASIRHPNVVQVHELVATEQDHLLVMEYLEGEACSVICRKASVDPVVGAWIAAEAAAGLGAAHKLTTPDGREQNLIHRDVTPHNIFVTYGGEVKVLDFGVARTDHRYVETQTGAIKGKLAYMAPEQLQREPIDHRVDLFALGIVLWEMTTGQRLFARDSEGETVMAVCQDEIFPPSSVSPDYPEELDRILVRALNRDPAARFQSAEAFESELRKFVAASGRNPKQELVELLTERFAERREQKRLFASQGDGESVVPSPRDQFDAMLQAAHATPPTGETGLSVRPGPQGAKDPRVRMVVVGALLAAGLFAGLFVFLRDTNVRTRFVSTPAGATVTSASGQSCVTPCSIEEETSDEETRAEIALPGHDAQSVSYTRGSDTVVSVQLVATATAAPPELDGPGDIAAGDEPTAGDELAAGDEDDSTGDSSDEAAESQSASPMRARRGPRRGGMQASETMGTETMAGRPYFAFD